MKKLLTIFIILSIGRLWWQGKISLPKLGFETGKKDVALEKKLKVKELHKILDKHYHGGWDYFLKEVTSHLEYPHTARKNCQTGTVIIRVKVNYNGIADYKVVKDFQGAAPNVLGALQAAADHWKGMPFGHEPAYFKLIVAFNLKEHPQTQAGHITVTASTTNAKCLLDKNFHNDHKPTR
ncbi:hypothetical protein BKI52_23320 [marine bacterium AO1-C]|nr:hypothetical protein BKI52_23320 [marine bacterium AO1-C]